MNQLSANFKRSEFKCRCGNCLHTPVDFMLIEILEETRENFGSPITITSGYRCREHNRSIGSNDNSLHTFGMAADHYVHGVDVRTLLDYYDRMYPNDLGVGYYPNNGFIHLDTRERKARWMKK